MLLQEVTAPSVKQCGAMEWSKWSPNRSYRREEKSRRTGGGANILILRSWESRATSATGVGIGGAPIETKNSHRKLIHWEWGAESPS